MPRKDTIAEAYRKLVVERKTSKISVNEVCAECNISRTTFYKYFKDAFEIIEYTILEDAVITSFKIADYLYSGLDRIAQAQIWYTNLYKNGAFYMTIVNEDGQSSLCDTMLNILYENNKALCDRRYPDRSAADRDWFAYKSSALQVMLIRKWMNEGMKVPPQEIARYYHTNIWDR